MKTLHHIAVFLIACLTFCIVPIGAMIYFKTRRIFTEDLIGDGTIVLAYGRGFALGIVFWFLATRWADRTFKY